MIPCTHLVAAVVVYLPYVLHLAADLWQRGAEVVQRLEVLLQCTVDVRDGVREGVGRAPLRLLRVDGRPSDGRLGETARCAPEALVRLRGGGYLLPWSC